MLPLTTVTTLALAAAQPTAIGRELHRLTPWQGRIYAAYGDYGANTGPIHAVSVDLADFTVRDEATFQTEETWTYRETAGKFYAAFVDPQGGPPDGTPGQYAVATTPGSWTIVRSITPVPVHCMAVVETIDGIFAFGSGYSSAPDAGGAQIWRSADDGATWTVSLAPRPDTVSGDSRFYSALLFGDDIVTMASGSGRTFRWVAGSGVWTEVAPLTTTVWKETSDVVPFSHQGTPYNFVIHRGKPESQVYLSLFMAITADRAGEAAIMADLPTQYDVHDACAAGGSLWILTDDRLVVRAETDGTWAVIGVADDATIRSLAVDVTGGRLFFGTTDSRVLTTPIPA